MKNIRVKITAALFALLPIGSAPAGELSTERTDLTLSNLFSAGWDEPWSKRARTGAPDLSLLRVQTNFLVCTLRTDYFAQRPLGTSSDREVHFLGELVEYSFNRRLMLAALGNYQWIESRRGEDEAGGTYGALARLQLIDTAHTSYALNLRVVAPNEGLGATQTLASFALAGWHDLAPLGLGRTGLYWHLQEETFAGPHARGARQNDLTAALSIAHTWTRPECPLGNLSTFLELYARTDLDGAQARRVFATLTPGIRCNVARHHVLMAGLEVPVTTPRTFEHTFRFTYMYSF